MKKIIAVFFTSVSVFFANGQAVADFENLNLAPESFWNGVTAPLGTSFTSGAAIFPNFFDTAFGGFWSEGWAYSTMRDTATGDFTNLYSAITYNGTNQSNTYIVGQNNSVVNLDNNAIGKVIDGCYITNTTYAFKSMSNGDSFAKQFGGPSGNDPDFFKLTIKGWYQGVQVADSVEFYLADYRFSDNSQDYIVNSWEWVDLQPLGNLDSLSFALSSSDTGSFGMNTPAFFCLDDFTTTNSGLHTSTFSVVEVTLFPNPTVATIQVNGLSGASNFTIINNVGELVARGVVSKNKNIDVSALPKGVYYLILDQSSNQAKKFIKQ